MKTIDIILVVTYILCFSFIAHVANTAFKSASKNKEEVKILLYEGGYIDGARSGANHLYSDSLTFEDWLEVKKQDSIQAMETYKHL